MKVTCLTGEDSSTLFYGTSTTNGKRKGDVVSLMLASRIIEEKPNADFEIGSYFFMSDTGNWYMWKKHSIVDGGTPWA